VAWEVSPLSGRGDMNVGMKGIPQGLIRRCFAGVYVRAEARTLRRFGVLVPKAARWGSWYPHPARTLPLESRSFKGKSRSFTPLTPGSRGDPGTPNRYVQDDTAVG